MLEQGQIKKIKEAVVEFFEKMTMPISGVEVALSPEKKEPQGGISEAIDVIDLDIKVEEPQILIGQGGQTLFEIQRLLRTILNKRLSRLQSKRGPSISSGQNIFYFNLDINDYKRKKVEYLKDLAKELADQVALNKEKKVLLPMSAYERRVIHAELAQRTDITTESQGDGFDRHIVIKVK